MQNKVIMNIEELSTKIELSQAATDLYIEDKFSIPNLTGQTGYSASQIYALFANKNAILKFYYPALIFQYRAMIAEIEDFETYSISEKLSNFAFTLFDMMEERRAFVDNTFEKWEGNYASKSEFQQEIKKLFKEFFTTDGNIATSAGFFMGDLFYGALKAHYIYLIKFWLQDDRQDQERTFALVDKITAFIEELVYSKIADKGFDLMKYSLNAFGFNQKMKDVNTWFTNWFRDESEVEVEINDEDEDANHE
jgi:hypothetical protein